MKNLLVLLSSLLLYCGSLNGKIIPVRLTCEYLVNPAVIDVPNPRLSWVNIADEGERGQYQTGYEIRVAPSRSALEEAGSILWQSGWVKSGNSVNVRYAGPSLLSGQECWWQVRVRDRKGKAGEWSEPAFWRMGLLNESDWNAKWIGAPWQGEEALPKPSNPAAPLPTELPPPAPLLRHEFAATRKVSKAVAFVTGLGYFELYLNGKKVGNDVLVPNQTNYGKRPDLTKENIPLPDNFREYRVMYLAYDITDDIVPGQNAIGAILGNGFYNPAKYWCGAYGSPRFIMQLHITYDDGTSQIVVSDETWKASKSPLLMDMIFYGEHYDARLEQEDWCKPGFDDSKWQNAALRIAPEGKMSAHMGQADKVMEVLEPVMIEKTGEGRYKVDFGQEISGWVHLKNLRGEAGRKIEIKYLQPYSPNGANTYTMKGGTEESYSARFTWFVFREVELVNWPGELTADQVKAEAVYTGVETTGKFSSSNKLLEDINRIWWRSQTDNMHGGIASDCPNRERSPYTGDGQVACVTVMHNFDARAFYRKWIDDIIGSSDPETGYVPNGAPWQPGCGGGVAWGAAISIMPWEYYLHYGDTSILRDSYDAMKGYIRYMLKWTDADGIMYSQAPGKDGKPLRWLNLGDWAQPYELPPDNLVHTFYLWYCADLTSKTASVLGLRDEAFEMAVLAGRTWKAFMERFWDEKSGSYGKFGGNIFALRMGVPADRKERVVKALKNDIIANNGHLDTGIFGTQFFFEVLSDNGLHKMAYDAISKTTAPGYGYWVEKGSTTSWEGWKRAGSGNHPMFGGGLVWLYRKLAGINADPGSPGYRKLIFNPMPAEGLTSVSYSNMTPYGKCSISWKIEGKMFYVDVEVPAGTKATVIIPAVSPKSVSEGGRHISKYSKSIKLVSNNSESSSYIIGSGTYSFSSELPHKSLLIESGLL